jgi:hypothetical protein
MQDIGALLNVAAAYSSPSKLWLFLPLVCSITFFHETHFTATSGMIMLWVVVQLTTSELMTPGA